MFLVIPNLKNIIPEIKSNTQTTTDDYKEELKSLIFHEMIFF